MRPWLVLVAVIFAAAALCLPAEPTARLLAGSERPDLFDVVRGVWALKALLLFHAVVAALLARVPLPRGEFRPLLTFRGGRFEPPRATDRTIVIGILVAGAALRLYDLGDQLWLDEIQTLIRYVQRPLGTVLTTFDSENQHLLYSVLARITVALFGESNTTLRLPAAIFGVASLWALWSFAPLVTGRREALFAVAFLAVSYHHVWFSQNARGYSGLLFFTLLGSGAWLRLLTARGPVGWETVIAYAVSTSLALATHFTALLVVAAQAIVWLGLLLATARQRELGPNRWLPAIALLLASSLSLLCYALLLPKVLVRIPRVPTLGNAVHFGEFGLWILDALRTVGHAVPGGWVSLVPGAAIVGCGLWSYFRQSVALLALFLLAVLMTAAAILLLHRPVWPRLFFFGAGFFVLIFFRGVFRLGEAISVGANGALGRRIAFAAAVLLCIGSAATLPRAYAPKQDFEGPIAYLRSAAGPDDAVAMTWLASYPYQYLFRTDWRRIDSVADLQTLEAGHPRTWVVYTMGPMLKARRPEIWQRLQEDYQAVKVFRGTLQAGEIILRVHDRDSPRSPGSN